MKLFDKLKFSHKTAPWFLFSVSVLAFGLLIPWLGFYQDDWHHVYYYSQEGIEGLQRFFYTDSRPFAFIVMGPLFRLFGTYPLGWHIGILLFRFLTALVFLCVLNLIWPQSQKESLLVTTFFLVYPVFLLQPMSVAYSLHWSMYLTYMVSIWLMLLAIRKPRFFVPLTFASLFLEMFHLLIIEYFVGLELLRPILIFFALREESGQKRFALTIKTWIPYLLIWSAYIPFRISFDHLFGYERNVPSIVFALFQKPLLTLSYLLQTGLQDFTSIFLTSWYDSLQPSQFDLSRISNILILLLTLVLTAGCWVYFSRIQSTNAPSANQQDDWAKQIIFVGLLATLFGVLPGWAVGKSVYASNNLWSDRFALATMFGAGMVCVGVVYLLIHIPSRRYFILSLLIALAVGSNLRTAIDYKASWEKQKDFYWQLAWRAPYIKPNTALISDSEFLFFMGIYPTSYAINTLYPKTTPALEVNYWLYAYGSGIGTWNDFLAGESLIFFKYSSKFNGVSTNSLAIDFMPEQAQCLWIVRPEDAINPFLPAMTYQFLPASNLNQIQVIPPVSWSTPNAILGKEPPHNWCYFFEKADLARQFKDWASITRLWEAVSQAKVRPRNGVEFAPFIEGYAFSGDWKMAQELTLRANLVTQHMPDFLCALWETIQSKTRATPEQRAVIQTLHDKLGCFNLNP